MKTHENYGLSAAEIEERFEHHASVLLRINSVQDRDLGIQCPCS